LGKSEEDLEIISGQGQLGVATLSRHLKYRKPIIRSKGKSDEDLDNISGQGQGQLVIAMLAQYIKCRRPISGIILSASKMMLLYLRRERRDVVLQHTSSLDHSNNLNSFKGMMEFARATSAEAQ
jgi:hypothetical protein